MRIAMALCLGVVSILPLPAFAARVQLAGQVTYREHIALPETAMLEIQLVDQTLANLPPRIDVRGPVGPGQVPLSFTLSFEDSLVLPGHSYALIAAISDQGGLLFRNFEPYAVDPLAPAQPVLIVANFVGRIRTGESSSAEPPASPPAILDAIWTATSIGGKPVVPRTSPTLSIGADMRAGGSTGCNSWFAEAELTGDMVHLGSITTTLRACMPPVNQQEQAFKDALTAAATWQVSGDDLTLYGVDGTALMVLRR